jgi:hypothetical protein
MPPAKPAFVACPVCAGPVVLVVSEVFDLELEPATGRMNGRRRSKDTLSPLSIPTTGSRHGCTICGRTWTAVQFNRAWRAAGCPTRP